ncbi:MAG: glycosyltransferase [Acidobacteria bacterium]|nr:glycosyltransferase [Acidobacteriota bacterium]
MRAGLVISSDKFTGAAAVAEHWCRALNTADCEARLLFVAGANLERRLSGLSWALPGLAKERSVADVRTNIRALRKMAETSDVVITFLPHDHLEAVIAGVHRRSPLIRAFRNPRHLRLDPFHLWLARRCSGALSPFENLAARTKRLIGGRPVASIPVPVEDRFRPGPDTREARGRLGMDPEMPVIGMVGKLAQGRGFETLLHAAARIKSQCRIVVVGHGELQPSLEQLARSLGIADQITWTGKREDDLPLLLCAMDAVVFSAPGSDWGHRVISEAQACGRPVIAAPIAGVEDLVEHQCTGLIAADSQGIADAFDRSIDDPDLARRLKQNASDASADRRFARIGRRLAAFLEEFSPFGRSPYGGAR